MSTATNYNLRDVERRPVGASFFRAYRRRLATERAGCLSQPRPNKRHKLPRKYLAKNRVVTSCGLTRLLTDAGARTGNAAVASARMIAGWWTWRVSLRKRTEHGTEGQVQLPQFALLAFAHKRPAPANGPCSSRHMGSPRGSPDINTQLS